MTGTPNFIAIELDISDSGREGCAVSTLTITSEPKDWKEAIAVGIQEIRRMQRHGLTHGEFLRYREAILRDSSQLAEQVGLQRCFTATIPNTCIASSSTLRS